MKWDRFIDRPHKTKFVGGDWNVIDDETGFKVKASTVGKQWDGFRLVDPKIRHPQDFLRSRTERIRTPWARPEVADTFRKEGVIFTNGNFVNTTGWTLGSSWGIANGFATWTAGSTDTMYQSVNAQSGKIYEVTFDLFSYVGAGGLTPSIGTQSGTTRTQNGTYTEQITSDGVNDRLTFTPTAGGTSFNIDNVRVLRVG